MASSPAQQAAIAISMKKAGKSPKAKSGRKVNAFKKINRSNDPSSRYFWMNKMKKDLSEVQPNKTTKKK